MRHWALRLSVPVRPPFGLKSDHHFVEMINFSVLLSLAAQSLQNETISTFSLLAYPFYSSENMTIRLSWESLGFFFQDFVKIG